MMTREQKLRNKGFKMRRMAFTMVELVMVIVVLGILSALALPRMERDLRQEAADNVLSAIRYTQHLALVDNRHKFNKAKWQQRFWRIYFGSCSGGMKFYAIGTDDDMEDSTNARVDQNESALDPANGKVMWGQDAQECEGTIDSALSENTLIGRKYGVDTITGGCGNVKYIAFDYLGRPYGSGFSFSSQPNNTGYMTSDCSFTFSSSSSAFEPFTVIIKKETGYTYIDGQEES